MIEAFNGVRDFHFAGAAPVLSRPQFPSAERMDLRDKLLREEYQELNTALDNLDLVKVADNLIDMIYILLGTCCEFGIPADRVWDLVQAANMAKRFPDGKIHKQGPDDEFPGKVIKPPGWESPDEKIRRLLLNMGAKL